MKVLLRNPKREVEVDGPITVHALLQRFDLSPETVLVIVGDELVTHDVKLADDAAVEIRPVISGWSVVKCRVCKGPAVIDVRRHNAAFCKEHFVHHCDEQVRRAIHSHTMLEPGERVLVAVSGGKDSLALWEILVRLGYEADGLYLGLGIGDYSDESGVYTREFAARLGRPLLEVDLAVRPGLHDPGSCGRHPPGAVRRVRTVEAPPLQLGGDRARVRRRRHRPQPRRRGRGAPRQRAPLGRRLPRPAAPGAPRRARASCAR